MLNSYCFQNKEGKPFYHSNFRSGLEKITIKNVSSDDKDIFNKLFSEKTKSLGATITSILEEIHLREDLDIHVMKKIEENISEQKLQLDHLCVIGTQYSLDWFSEISSHKRKIEDSILELEKEKRKEYLECWRDLLFLKKYLLSALKEFWEFKHKRGFLLSNTNNEIPRGD